MALDWLSFGATVAASAVGTGLAAFVLRASVSHLFSKDLETFRTRLSRSLFEHQTKFAWLHTERSKVLVELYRQLAKLDTSFTNMLRPVQLGGDEHRNKMRANAINAMTAFFEFFDANKVFFDEKLVKQVKMIQEEYRMVWATFVPTSEFWGFRTMPISVPGMPITGSGLMAITIPG